MPARLDLTFNHILTCGRCGSQFDVAVRGHCERLRGEEVFIADAFTNENTDAPLTPSDAELLDIERHGAERFIHLPQI